MALRFAACGSMIILLSMAACDPGTRYDSEFMDEQDVEGVDSTRSQGDDPFAPGSFEEADKQASECTKMDIVFVVDDSGSMREEQDNLARNFPRFVSALDAFRTQGGTKLDWRAAVTTTTVNSQRGGKFESRSACGGSRAWVEAADSNAASVFSCLAQSAPAAPPPSARSRR